MQREPQRYAQSGTAPSARTHGGTHGRTRRGPAMAAMGRCDRLRLGALVNALVPWCPPRRESAACGAVTRVQHAALHATCGVAACGIATRFNLQRFMQHAALQRPCNMQRAALKCAARQVDEVVLASRVCNLFGGIPQVRH